MTGRRWARSDVTFGPAGRLVATGLVLLPAVWCAYTTPIGLLIYGGVIVPWALRDVWRRAPRTAAQDQALQRRLQAALDSDGRPRESTEQPQPPSRW